MERNKKAEKGIGYDNISNGKHQNLKVMEVFWKSTTQLMIQKIQNEGIILHTNHVRI